MRAFVIGSVAISCLTSFCKNMIKAISSKSVYSKIIRNKPEAALLPLVAILPLLDPDPVVGVQFVHLHGDIGGGVQSVAAAPALTGIFAKVIHQTFY